MRQFHFSSCRQRILSCVRSSLRRNTRSRWCSFLWECSAQYNVFPELVLLYRSTCELMICGTWSSSECPQRLLFYVRGRLSDCASSCRITYREASRRWGDKWGRGSLFTQCAHQSPLPSESKLPSSMPSRVSLEVLDCILF